jgi:hypothetical protein
MIWERFTTPRGTVVFFRTQQNCLENVIWGHMDTASAVRLQQEFDALREKFGDFRGFHHWANVPNYDTECRVSWVNWLRRQSGALKETHFLTRSPLVRMGLSVANIAFSEIKFVVHSDESAYVEARRPFMSRIAIPTPAYGERAR